MKTSISACIMVRNEEKNLPGLLTSINGVVDEVVVIDHESTDRTVELLHQSNAKILHLPNFTVKKWGDSERPILNQHANGEWILHIDADERLTDDARKRLPDMAKQSNYDVIWLLSKHFYAPGKWFRYGFYSPHPEPRFYRRSCKINWNVKIHESPRIDGRHFYSDIAYDHLFYTADNERMRSKHETYIKVEREQKAAYLSKNHLVKWFFILAGYIAYFIKGFFFKLAFMDGWVGITTNHFLAQYFARSGYLEIVFKKKLGLIKYDPFLKSE